MKKIEALIASFKFDEVKEALAEAGIQSATISEVRNWDQHRAPVVRYRGTTYMVEFRPEVKVEVIVEDEEVKKVTDAIIGVLRTGHLGDGQIAILPVEAVIRVRTGVRSADMMTRLHGFLRGGHKLHRPHSERDGLAVP